MEHVEKTEKHGKWDTHTIGTGLLRKKLTKQMRNSHVRSWNMLRNTEKCEK